MKHNICILLLLLLLTKTLSQAFYGDLAISWLQGFCDFAGDCMDRKIEDWDHQSFTIHGLWPKISGQSIGQFDIDLFDSELLDEMRNFWPPQSKRTHTQYFLWEHELQDHGKDYIEVLKRFGNTGTNQELQVQFFRDVIALYNSFNFKKLPKDTWTVSELGEYIGLADDQWYPRCNEQGEIQELRICLKLRPQGNTPNKCLKTKPKNCDLSNLILSEWKESTQERVVLIDTTDL